MTSIWVRWMNLDTQMKHRMKHPQVFIWDETCFSSEIKHFLLFHLRRHVKKSGFVLHHGFQTPRNRWKSISIDILLEMDYSTVYDGDHKRLRKLDSFDANLNSPKRKLDSTKRKLDCFNATLNSTKRKLEWKVNMKPDYRILFYCAISATMWKVAWWV